MIELGMHTDNWRTLSGSFQSGVEAAARHGLQHIEFGLIDGQYFIQGLGYEPSISLKSNPRALRRYLDEKGLRVSQIDAAFPMMGPEGATFGVQYVQQAIRFAHELGCPYVDTTDGAEKAPGYSDEELLAITRENYRQVLSWAEDYEVTVNIEPHGPLTTDPDSLEKIFGLFDSERLGLNFDTGNTFIAGRDPVEFLKRFRPRLRHVHVKDVSEDLARAARGEETGIATSAAPIGGGANADNIRQCVQFLQETRWSGVLSIECLGLEDNVRRSVEFLRGLLG